MVVSWLSVLVVVGMPVLRLSYSKLEHFFLSGTHGHVFLELCCASDSVLAAVVVEHPVAIRASSEDIQLVSTRRVLHRLLRICKAYDVVVDIWVSIPCTVGAPFRLNHEKLGAETSDLAMTYKLIVAAVGLCRHAVRIGGGFSWEWSNGNELWNLEVVRSLFGKCGSSSCFVLTAAVGQQFADREGGVFYVKKKWKIVTTRPKLIEVMAPYARIPGHLGSADFRPCSGKVCTDSAHYTPLFAELVWRALLTVVVMPARFCADLVPEGCLPASKPSLPLLCAMVTRTVTLKSEEGQEPGAKEAVAKEVASHAERCTWDLSRVREMSEWMRDDTFSELLVGRVFVVLGVKFAEMAKSECKFRARAVFQGKNIWSRFSRSVYEIFDEVSHSPFSLTAARTAMAIGMLRRMRASYRTPQMPTLQALLDVDPGVINLVELPRSWWPRSWFEDDCMTIRKNKRPAVPLVYALPGHPKSGNVWEEHAESILAKLGWRKVAGWNGVFVHADLTIICLYVDDFMKVATDDLARRHWAEIVKHIVFKEEAAPLKRYLGANYMSDEFSLKQPDRARRICEQMADNLIALVARFQDDHPDAKLYPVTSPYLLGRRQRPAGSVPGSVCELRSRARSLLL